MITKLHAKSFWRDGNVLYLVWSGDYTDVYICQNLLNCTFEMDTFCYVNYISIK